MTDKKSVLERALDLLSKIDTDEAQRLYQDVGVIWDEVEAEARREERERIKKLWREVVNCKDWDDDEGFCEELISLFNNKLEKEKK